ncbi:hypothetical protein PROFUN_12782 [Planoprotostelium fungivorum]|uniref:Magnesium transporter n=1 Tax=Planoprotostelium fungivorum TaxID=1890364 RepID=A0A2P6N6H5_9EUKA|nr:hypothetical protein PROFUN_12782 [Planoprotostelium fungivorum]
MEELHRSFARGTTLEQFSSLFRSGTVELEKTPSDSRENVIVSGEGKDEGFRTLSMREVIKLNPINRVEGVLWIDVVSPSQEDLNTLESLLSLHPLTVEDIREQSSEKIEIFDDYLYILVRELDTDSGSLAVASNINILLFPHAIVTVRFKDTEVMHKGILSGDRVLHSILDSIASQYTEYVDAIYLEAETLDELVLVFNSDVQNELLRRIGTARRLLTTLRTHIWSLKELLTNINVKKHPLIGKEMRIYLRDVLDHAIKMEEKLHNSKEMVNNLHSTYLARISVEVADYSNQVNKIVKKFGAVATIFIPLTLIAGLFGMNVKVPGRDDNTYTGFFIIIGGSLLFSIICLFIFIKAGWF